MRGVGGASYVWAWRGAAGAHAALRWGRGCERRGPCWPPACSGLVQAGLYMGQLELDVELAYPRMTEQRRPVGLMRRPASTRVSHREELAGWPAIGRAVPA